MANFTNDDRAVYDIARHRYVLLQKALEDKGLAVSGAFSDPDRDIPAFMARISDECYSALLSGVRDRKATLYWLSLPENRQAMIDLLSEVGYSMMTYRTENSADPASRGETLSQLARRMAMTSDLYFRGYLDQTLVPFGFMDKSGEDW